LLLHVCFTLRQRAIKAIKDRRRCSASISGRPGRVPVRVDTKSQILGLKDFKPDVVWHGNTTMSVSATMRDAYALGLGADHIVNVWGFDETCRVGGESRRRAMAVSSRILR